MAPISSFDLSMKTGLEIPIETRPSSEILEFRDIKIAPKESRAFNPSFDVTSAELITGIICESGIISPVTPKNLANVVNK